MLDASRCWIVSGLYVYSGGLMLKVNMCIFGLVVLAVS